MSALHDSAEAGWENLLVAQTPSRVATRLQSGPVAMRTTRPGTGCVRNRCVGVLRLDSCAFMEAGPFVSPRVPVCIAKTQCTHCQWVHTVERSGLCTLQGLRRGGGDGGFFVVGFRIKGATCDHRITPASCQAHSNGVSSWVDLSLASGKLVTRPGMHALPTPADTAMWA